MSGDHVFVDESTERDYLMVAGVVVPGNLDDVRRLVRSLTHRGSSRIHMSKESDTQRKLICSKLVAADLTATVYIAPRPTYSARNAREACLEALVEDCAKARHSRLVIERDDSLVRGERRRLIELTRQYGCQDLVYEHRRATDELLLCVPDVLAWCWAKGGTWRSRIQPLVTATRTV